MAKRLRINATAEFLAVMDDIESDRVVEHVGRIIGHLQVFPDMGNPRPRTSLRERYGEDIRSAAVDGFLLVYRHDDECLHLVTLVPGKLVC